MDQRTTIRFSPPTFDPADGCTEAAPGRQPDYPDGFKPEPACNAGKPAFQTRENNPNWKGGRSVASNGYVLIRVGVGHPAADCRGYAYEHRLVAAEKIGRSIAPGEHVHHENGDKADNRPENLTVMASQAEHFVAHRTSGKRLRMPGEANPDVECGCGCGKTFPLFDVFGRPRVFVSGHNPPSSSLKRQILELLSKGPLSLSDIVTTTGGKLGSVKTALSQLKGAGRLVRLGVGVYGRGGD